MKELKFYAHRDMANFGAIALHVIRRLEGEHPRYAKEISFAERTAGEEGVYQPPAILLQMDDAQRLIDALWDVGIRPTEGSGSAGALAATERHLTDMRTLVFQHQLTETQKPRTQ